MFLVTDNSLFSSSNDSAESKENGSLAAKTHSTSKLVGATGGGSGLFDDEDEEDDFFSSKSLKTPDSGTCFPSMLLCFGSGSL